MKGSWFLFSVVFICINLGYFVSTILSCYKSVGDVVVLYVNIIKLGVIGVSVLKSLII